MCLVGECWLSVFLLFAIEGKQPFFLMLDECPSAPRIHPVFILLSTSKPIIRLSENRASIFNQAHSLSLDLGVRTFVFKHVRTPKPISLLQYNPLPFSSNYSQLILFLYSIDINLFFKIIAKLQGYWNRPRSIVLRKS